MIKNKITRNEYSAIHSNKKHKLLNRNEKDSLPLTSNGAVML